jgi:uncharacterized protein
LLSAQEAEEKAMHVEISKDERMWAMLAYLLTFVAPILAPLVIYFVKRDESRFVGFHALQSLFLDLICIVVAALAMVLGVALGFALVAEPFLGMPLAFLVMFGGPAVASLASIVYTILGAVRSYNGEWYSIPMAGSLAARNIGP